MGVSPVTTPSMVSCTRVTSVACVVSRVAGLYGRGFEWTMIGVNSQPIIVHSNPLPYKPATLDTTQATLVTRVHETIEGVVTGETPITSDNWAWDKCTSWADHLVTPHPDPTQICVNGGFIPSRVYQVVFTAKDPY